MTGENIELLYKFLNAVPPLQSQESLEQQPAEFQVDELFNVPEVGTVLGGILTRGVVQVGDSILVGPNECGEFSETKVATIRRNRTPCRMVKAGQAATVTVTLTEHPDFRKVSIVIHVETVEDSTHAHTLTHSHTYTNTHTKGTVLLSPSIPLNSFCNSCSGFVADLCILSSTGTGVKKGFQGTVFVASSKQNADISEITGKVSQTN